MWQLAALRRHFNPVRAAELPSAASGRRWGTRLPVALTLDDDLSSHRRVALPALRRAGVVATFFLCGASLERPFAFWWEHLQRAADRGHSPSRFVEGAHEGESIHAVSARIQEMAPADRGAVIQRLAEAAGDEQFDGMPADDVRAIAAAGFEIGFHTARHDSLPTLDDDALERAMQEGRPRLEPLTGRPLTAIAYPHGRADDRVGRAARRGGFQHGFTTAARAVRPKDDPLLLARFEPGESVLRFAVALCRLLLRP
jgi:peptidoglycan/xylan/chitin deacetylase (PgdA/CDA1 family)